MELTPGYYSDYANRKQFIKYPNPTGNDLLIKHPQCNPLAHRARQIYVIIIKIYIFFSCSIVNHKIVYIMPLLSTGFLYGEGLTQNPLRGPNAGWRFHTFFRRCELCFCKFHHDVSLHP